MRELLTESNLYGGSTDGIASPYQLVEVTSAGSAFIADTAGYMQIAARMAHVFSRVQVARPAEPEQDQDEDAAREDATDGRLTEFRYQNQGVAAFRRYDEYRERRGQQ